MKNYKLVVLSTIVFLTIASATLFVSCKKNNNISTQEIPTTQESSIIKHTRMFIIMITITRGIDLSINCVDFHCIAGGPICEVNVDIIGSGWLAIRNPNNIDQTQCYGGLSMSDNGKLVMYFQKSSLSNEFSPYFNNGVMNMPKDKVIPLTKIEKLGFTSDYTIKQGNYNYTEDNNFIIVTL